MDDDRCQGIGDLHLLAHGNPAPVQGDPLNRTAVGERRDSHFDSGLQMLRADAEIFDVLGHLRRKQAIADAGFRVRVDTTRAVQLDQQAIALRRLKIDISDVVMDFEGTREQVLSFNRQVHILVFLVLENRPDMQGLRVIVEVE
ncbi:hypothetical protein D3C81_1656870 [compost metagenome]